MTLSKLNLRFIFENIAIGKCTCRQIAFCKCIFFALNCVSRNVLYWFPECDFKMQKESKNNANIIQRTNEFQPFHALNNACQLFLDVRLFNS